MALRKQMLPHSTQTLRNSSPTAVRELHQAIVRTRTFFAITHDDPVSRVLPFHAALSSEEIATRLQQFVRAAVSERVVRRSSLLVWSVRSRAVRDWSSALASHVLAEQKLRSHHYALEAQARRVMFLAHLKQLVDVEYQEARSVEKDIVAANEVPSAAEAPPLVVPLHSALVPSTGSLPNTKTGPNRQFSDNTAAVLAEEASSRRDHEQLCTFAWNGIVNDFRLVRSLYADDTRLWNAFRVVACALEIKEDEERRTITEQ